MTAGDIVQSVKGERWQEDKQRNRQRHAEKSGNAHHDTHQLVAKVFLAPFVKLALLCFLVGCHKFCGNAQRLKANLKRLHHAHYTSNKGQL